jgi:hypothetical protein
MTPTMSDTGAFPDIEFSQGFREASSNSLLSFQCFSTCDVELRIAVRSGGRIDNPVVVLPGRFR